MNIIERYVERMMTESTPEEPLWNIEKIKAGSANGWNYIDGCMMIALLNMNRITGEERYYEFAEHFLDHYVFEDGSIRGFKEEDYNLDNICEGRVLFDVYKKSGKEKYRKAIDTLYGQILRQPRTPEGNFWHKAIYPNQVWLDGLYMVQPFYMEYEMKFGGMEKLADITNHFKNARKYLWDAEKGLNYHAFDEKKQMFWADKETGHSANFWLRSNGWYLMALADTIGLCSEMMYEHYRALVDIFSESIMGILRYQAADGLFYQVIDHPETEGNYTETSGSAMVAYALLKGVRLGILDPEKYLPVGKRVFEALVNTKMKEEDDCVTRLTDICWVAGLGPEKSPQRDGSVAYYLSEPKKSDDAKGVGPFIMAYSEYLQAQ